MSSATLDTLREELADANRRLTAAKARQNNAQADVRECIARIKRINEALENGGRFELQVSEHAMLRFAERVLGFDTKDVLRAVADKVEPAAYLLGDCKVPISPGYVAVVRGKTVVTIEPA